ncbi:MAG: AsmA family protein [Alphaproteobacteria bacterium]|nr:AsmA family protein [Alphaproteobacteria bacterium]
MRRALILAGGILAILVVALIGFIVFFPKDAAIAEVERQIEKSTQRDLTIEGDVSLAFFPSLGFTAERVALSNPEGFADGDFISARNVVFALAVLPLLRGDIEVKRLNLDDAQINLIAGPEATANWTFPQNDPAQPESALQSLKLENVRLNGARLSFQGADGDPILVEAIDASLTLDSLDTPATLNAALTYRGERIEIDATADAPRALLNKGVTPIALQVESDVVNAALTGEADTSGGALSGQFEASGASLRRVLAWMGSPLSEGDQFAAFSVAGAMRADDGAIAITGGRYRLDAIEATGDAGLRAGDDDRLQATGALQIATLNLNPYLPPPSQAGAAPEGGVNVGTAWSDAPLGLAGLNAIDADIALAVGALQFQRMQFSAADLRLSLTRGLMDATLSRIALYSGSGTARLRVNARDATPSVTLETDLANVQALPFLTDAIGFNKIEGRGRLVANVSGQGASQAAIMRGLRGTMGFTFNDGAWKGVNLARVARMVQAALTGAEVGPASETDFAEFAASFQVANGVATTSDLRMLNPFVRLEGQGDLNIGQQSIDMRITPRAVRSSQGQGGAFDTAGIGVPFRVTGPWGRPSFRPDLGDAIRSRVQEQIQNRLGGALGRSKTGDAQQSQTQGNVLQGLIPRR